MRGPERKPKGAPRFLQGLRAPSLRKKAKVSKQFDGLQTLISGGSVL